MAISIQGTTETDSGNRATEGIIESNCICNRKGIFGKEDTGARECGWDVSNQCKWLEPAGMDVDDAFNHGTCMDSGNLLGIAPLNNLDHLSHQQVDGELGDLRDEVALVASPKNALIRASSENLLGVSVASENNLDHVSRQQVDDELAD
ncbi:hypothetical protein FH972_000852 [Carpinus fangiana]|uniref:Uncharacterized protein n=1 Tax=Carpinus fangiana TaxID=176857 RepID=A0A5N6QCL6_9ROSI|nr:hypothetical protein FH972_000852 [Carpinus fangiana]